MSYIEELHEQPEVLSELNRKNDDEVFIGGEFDCLLQETDCVIFTGMGSSYVAGYIGAAYLTSLGKRSFAMEPDTLRNTFGGNVHSALIIAISQSGESRETVDLVKEIPNDRYIAVVNYKGSLLDRLSRYKVYIYAGEEKYSATKTYTNTILAVVRLVEKMTGTRNSITAGIGEICRYMEKLIHGREKYRGIISDFFSGRDSVCLIGSGISYSTVYQADVILNEMCRIATKALTGGQFFHGIVESVNKNFTAVIFDGDPDYADTVERVLDFLEEKGSRCMLITNNSRNRPQNADFTRIDIPAVNRYLTPILDVIFIEMIGYYLSLGKKLVPGELTYVKK